LPNQELERIETNIVRVINDSFVITADLDYLLARFLALKGLNRSFFWSASQAIEKYLKAYLLMNGKSIAKFSNHKLFPLLTEAKKIDPTLCNIDFKFHSSLRIDKTAKKHLKNLNLDDFIRYIETHGSPKNRYNLKGIDFNTAYILGLDNFVFSVRNRIGVPDIHTSFHKIDHDLMHAFRINNPFFNGRDTVILHAIPSDEFPIHIGMSSTHLDFLKKNFTNGIELNWLNIKMKL
jgi:hypothetical protein